MPDELTGPAEGGIPDSGTDESAPPDDLDPELAKHLNLESPDQLPSDPRELKKLVVERYKDIRTGLRRAQEDKSEWQQKVARMEGQLEQLTRLLPGQENGNQRSIPDWVKSYTPPEDASDTEVLADFVDHAVEPLRNTVNRLAEMYAMEKVREAQSKYDDWSEIESEVAETLNRYPNMPLDEAVQHARGSNPDTMRERIRRELQAELEQKKQAAGSGATVTRPGTGQTTEKSPDVRSTSLEKFMDWGRQQAEEELGIGT